MEHPIRSVIRCRHNGNTLGSVVVIRGDPMYDENHAIIGYKNKYMQIRRGNLKGKECREIFNSLDDWYESLGLYKKVDVTTHCMNMGLLLTIVLTGYLGLYYLSR